MSKQRIGRNPLKSKLSNPDLLQSKVKQEEIASHTNSSAFYVQEAIHIEPKLDSKTLEEGAAKRSTQENYLEYIKALQIEFDWKKTWESIFSKK